jgi:hypothetical protein
MASPTPRILATATYVRACRRRYIWVIVGLTIGIMLLVGFVSVDGLHLKIKAEDFPKYLMIGLVPPFVSAVFCIITLKLNFQPHDFCILCHPDKIIINHDPNLTHPVHRAGENLLLLGTADAHQWILTNLATQHGFGLPKTAYPNLDTTLSAYYPQITIR